MNSKKREEALKNEKEKKKGKKWILILIILLLVIFFVFYLWLFDIGNLESDEYSIDFRFTEPITSDKNWTFNFSRDLITFIKEENFSPPYIFFIGYGAGDLPEGLVLNENGVLIGKPTGVGGKFIFQVCVEDAIRNILCKVYELEVDSEIDNKNVPSDTPGSKSADDPFVGTWKTSSPVVYYGVQKMEDEGYEEVTAVIHLEIRKDKGYENMGYCINSWTTERNSRQIGDLISGILVHKDWDGHEGYMSPLDQDCVRYSEYSHLDDGWWSDAEITYKTENQMVITTYSPGNYHKELTLNLITQDELSATLDTFEYLGSAEIVKVPITFVRE